MLHHFFTNLVGIDEDVSAEPLLRLHEQQVWRIIHRAQPYYCWFVYGLLYLVWILWNDFKKLFQGHIEGHKIPITKKDRWVFLFTKLFHFGFFWAVPILIFGWRAFAIGYGIYGFTVGVTTAVVFQLAHIVEKTSQPKEEVATKEEWVFHEFATTANFATKNKLVGWFVGGLNFQIEHHLFPKISHVHYEALSKEVKQVCKDFNVEYHEYPTCWSAIRSHFRKMVDLSKKPKDIVVQL